MYLRGSPNAVHGVFFAVLRQNSNSSGSSIVLLCNSDGQLDQECDSDLRDKEVIIF